MNLRHFIYQRKTVHTTKDTDDNSSTEHHELSYHITKGPINHHSSEKFEDDSPPMDSTELQRVPTCSIFHKVASAPGVPHTFTGFIRQWPCLPRVVVSFIYIFFSHMYLIVCRSSCPFVSSQLPASLSTSGMRSRKCGLWRVRLAGMN